MPALVAAIKKEPARQLIQNLLSEFNRRSQPFTVGGAPLFDFEVGCEIEPVLTPPPGERYSIDISSDGAITAFFRANVYASYVEFSFNVNSVWPAGKFLGVICAKKIGRVCVLWTTMIMPRLPTLRIRIGGVPRIPIMALDVAFAVENLELGDLIDQDHRQLKARIKLLRIGAFQNGFAFAQLILDFISGAITSRLGQFGFLGMILKHILDFVDNIVRKILGPLQFAQAWLNFVESRVQNAVAGLIGRVFGEDPSIAIAVGRLPARKSIAAAFVSGGGQQQPPIYVNFEKIILDVNTDCPAGPELRLQVTAS